MKLLWNIQTLISQDTSMWSKFEQYTFHIQREKTSDLYTLTVFLDKEPIATDKFPFLKAVIMHIEYKYSEEYQKV